MSKHKPDYKTVTCHQPPNLALAQFNQIPKGFHIFVFQNKHKLNN